MPAAVGATSRPLAAASAGSRLFAAALLLGALSCADRDAGGLDGDAARDGGDSASTGGRLGEGAASAGSGGLASSGSGGELPTHPTCPSEPERAYRTSPVAFPGTLEAEDFDPGAYLDATPGNEGGAYRSDEDVDVKELGAGFAVGWMTAGEWLEYTVTVEEAGVYDLTLLAGTVEPGRTLELSQCGAPLGEPIAIPVVAAWGEVASTAPVSVELEAGVQILRLTVGASDYVDLDSLSVQRSDGSGTGGSGGIEGPWPPAATFDNPVLWEDLADTEVIRVGDAYYYTASNMHYSPGAPILRSFDLVNWEYAGHAVPVLDFSAKYDLSGGRAYVKGTWASTLTYRESNSTFYFLSCIEFGKTYVWTAPRVDGTWTKHPAINTCYYDAGYLLDDDKFYVAYGNSKISVAELSADGFSEVSRQQVYDSSASLGITLEGARFYKVDGRYYIWLTRPPNGQYVLRADEPFGPYEVRTVLDNVGAPVSGAGAPHQGGLVQTQSGDWYAMAFIDAFPGGRVPVLAPVTWSEDGWPSVDLSAGALAKSYAYPAVPRPARAVKSSLGRDEFLGPKLGHEWEWNHNPDTSKWSADGALKLQTATVTSDLYAARNTLSRRIRGPSSTATLELDYGAMASGDVAGLAMLRQSSAWIGLKKSGSSVRVVMVSGLTLDNSWNTTGLGTEQASADVSGGKIWLRVNADIRPGASRQATFSYSTDGVTFSQLGGGFTLNNSWEFFMGYRFALFNYATSALGGAVSIPWFEITTP